MGGLLRGVLLLSLLALLAPGAAWARDVEVVVRLDTPGLAQATRTAACSAPRRRRAGSTCARRRAAPTSRTRRSAERFEERLARELPRAHVYCRYRIVFNGLAVTLPGRRSPVSTGSADVYPGVTYRGMLDRSVPMIGAPAFWSLPARTRAPG